MSQPEVDAVVVGAGVLGLAHAYALGRRGLKVVVCERHPKAVGASIRNFGMIWPIGQPFGERFDLARQSAQIWQQIMGTSGLWYDPCGSLHLAHHDDEAQVIQEFIGRAPREACPIEWLDAQAILARYPTINPQGLKGGLWSPMEICVDPRQVIRHLPHWLQQTCGVEFRFGEAVRHFDDTTVTTATGTIRTRWVFVCTGSDFQELAPEAFANSGIIPCKLQMMRSQAFGNQYALGTMIAGGLTLRHYQSFAQCPTLPQLSNRFDRELPEYGRYGIHVLASQHQDGALTLGDTHEYGAAIEPFDRPALDDLVLDYLQRLLVIPNLKIVERWHGIYAKHPHEAYVVRAIGPRAWAVTGVGGAGMTLSFGLGELVVASCLGA